MMLGTDVSALSTTAATAAAQGLSIVVPLYNEAAGLAQLHQRLEDLARTLRQRYRLACEVVYVDDGRAAATRALARGRAADCLRVPGGPRSPKFRKEGTLVAGAAHPPRAAPRRRCGSFPSAIGFLRGWRAGSVSARSASTTSPQCARTAPRRSAPGAWSGFRSKALRHFRWRRCGLRACSGCCSPP